MDSFLNHTLFTVIPHGVNAKANSRHKVYYERGESGSSRLMDILTLAEHRALPGRHH